MREKEKRPREEKKEPEKEGRRGGEKTAETAAVMKEVSPGETKENTLSDQRPHRDVQYASQEIHMLKGASEKP